MRSIASRAAGGQPKRLSEQHASRAHHQRQALDESSRSAAHGAYSLAPKPPRPLDGFSAFGGFVLVGPRTSSPSPKTRDPDRAFARHVPPRPKFSLPALKREPLEVHGDGGQSREFTDIDNVVEANVLAARAPDVGGEAFNVGCGERVSLLQIVARLEEILGRPLERRHTAARPADVPHTLADVTKARRGLGYTPLVGFDEGLARTVEYFRHLDRT
jgi:UDP-N-acetylglucosamine/UDP-N-acetyl-alpha-D-glucosaminouronate 4-epimerase